MSPRRAVAPFTLILFGLVAAFALVRGKPASGTVESAPEPPLARVIAVQPEAVQLRVKSQGSVMPRTESDLIAQVQGEVTGVGPGLEPGAFFRAGDVLALLDAADLKLARDRAAAVLERARAEEEYAAANLERQEMLGGQGVASGFELDTARRNARITKAQRMEAEVDLARAERDLERTRIVAPFDGRTRSRAVNVGRFVSVGTPIARVYATDYAEIRLPIPDEDLAFLDIPMGVDLSEHDMPRVDFSARFSGRVYRWSGRVVRTEAEIDPRTRMVNVVARIPRPFEAGDRPPLAPGLFVDAEILGKQMDRVVRVPRSALNRDGSVWVLDEDDRLRRRPVEVVRYHRDHALVTRGLEAQDRVSLFETRRSREGLVVRPVEQSEILAGEAPAAVPSS